MKARFLIPGFMLLASTIVCASDLDVSSFKDYVLYRMDDIELYLDPGIARVAKTSNGPFSDLKGNAIPSVTFPYLGKATLVVEYSPGPSDDPTFIITYKGNTEYLGGEKLYISGNGFLYLARYSNECYPKKLKYSLLDGRIKEVAQPMYLIDQDCTTSTDLVLYEKVCNKGKAIATIPKGTSVHIIAADNEHRVCSSIKVADNDIGDQVNNYLVSTPFGLIGWVASSCGYLARPGRPLSCLRYYGD